MIRKTGQSGYLKPQATLLSDNKTHEMNPDHQFVKEELAAEDEATPPEKVLVNLSSKAFDNFTWWTSILKLFGRFEQITVSARFAGQNCGILLIQ